MTRLINLLEVITVGNDGECVFFSKDVYTKTDLLIAQTDNAEQWYEVFNILNPPYLKTGYTMYILTKHQK